MVGGHGDGSGDADAGSMGGDVHAEHDMPSHHEWVGKLPFLSLRFWTWAVTFFGLTGVALSLTGTSATMALLLAIAVGAGTGWGASFVFSRLTKTAVGVLPEASSHIGCEGRLLLPLSPGQRSKVRLRVGGADVDLVAESDGQQALPAGAPVWVVGLRGTHVVVEASPVPAEQSATRKAEKEES
jgi:membrane protein implicated in regulation of membrane protease activity